MRVLLLHPEDQLPAARPDRAWDLVVDLGRAPVATYQRWSKEAGGRVISLYDFGGGFDDGQQVRKLLQLGLGRWVDSLGVDWWDVLSLMIESDLRQLMRIRLLAQELDAGCELHTSRSSGLVKALQMLIGAHHVDVEKGVGPVRRWAQHYRDAFSRLDTGQIRQVFQDKFDREHTVRRRFARNRRVSGDAVVLLPSAYVNVSRTASSYAALLPSQKFLMVYARNSARLKNLPPNVGTASLDPYFMTPDAGEAAALEKTWESFKTYLVASAEEYSLANAVGMLDNIPRLLRWGTAVRDAWNQVFKSENVVGCLCADDSNPYTRIPLILASNRGIPTVACHHGALDSKMAVKVSRADTYIAKGEMERDYLLRSCGVGADRVMLGGQGLPTGPGPVQAATQTREAWLVFFTEPYEAAGWRSDEVYRDLLPELWLLAQSSGLKLVFKLHPFESVKGHRRILRKYLPQQEPEIMVIAGAPSAQLWSNTRCALTVQSTVALQCASLGIPVFLCYWLRDLTTGYVEQFSRFGVGNILESAEELREIPRILQEKARTEQLRPAVWETMDPRKLRELLLQTGSLSEAIKA
jgi:hypothetical protein